jgi:hypothetical protein
VQVACEGRDDKAESLSVLHVRVGTMKLELEISKTKKKEELVL